MARNPYFMPGFPLGTNNTQSEEALPTNDVGTPMALRDALNVDIPPDGKPRRRVGYTKVATTVAGHSAWSDDYIPWGLFVDGSNLCVMHENETIDVLRDDMASGLPVSYARINDQVWWSNGAQSGVVTQDLEQLSWSSGQPSGPPTVQATTGGQLPKGTYQVTITFIGTDGRESGAPLATSIDVQDDGAIYLSNIEQAPAGGRTRVYVTGGQDGVLRSQVTLPAGADEWLIDQPPKGKTLDTHLLTEMPAGQIVAYGNGRLFVAKGKEVLFSPTLRYGLFNARKDRVSFVERVQMMAFVADGTDGAGLYVSDTKRVYWFGGRDPSQWSQVIASATPALPGHIAWAKGSIFGLNTDTLLPCWHSVEGQLCVGTPGGNVLRPQPRDGMQDAAWDTGDSAALHFLKRPGDNRIVSSIRGARASGLAIQDRLVVREYRHFT